ncbi:hypothetical protein [Endozoicomonas sp. SESOKO1]|nr:hypothetical protein [Endozoicomonas sp. SESOKO1]
MRKQKAKAMVRKKSQLLVWGAAIITYFRAFGRWPSSFQPNSFRPR